MNANHLFLDYLWDLLPNYFHIKDDEADMAFNRPKLPIDDLDNIFLEHLGKGQVFIDKPISKNSLYIGLTEVGGRIWEECFDVRWKNYLYFEINEVNSKQEVDLYSQNKDLIFLIFPEFHSELSTHLQLLNTFNITYWKNLENCYVSKIVFDQEDDDDLWQRFHDANLPKWRNYFENLK